MRLATAAALASAMLLPGCIEFGVQPEDVDVPPGLAVPDAVYQVAYAYAANRVGANWFERIYEVDRELTGQARVTDCDPATCSPLARLPHWLVVFDVRLPDGSTPAGAEISVWPNGTIALEGDQPYYGLPDCRRRPASCLFLVSPDEARRSAERDGLEARGCPLDVLLGWSADLQRFGWQVMEVPCPQPMEYEGRGVFVDSATGRVESRFGFFFIAN